MNRHEVVTRALRRLNVVAYDEVADGPAVALGLEKYEEVLADLNGPRGGCTLPWGFNDDIPSAYRSEIVNLLAVRLAPEFERQPPVAEITAIMRIRAINEPDWRLVEDEDGDGVIVVDPTTPAVVVIPGTPGGTSNTALERALWLPPLLGAPYHVLRVNPAGDAYETADPASPAFLSRLNLPFVNPRWFGAAPGASRSQNTLAFVQSMLEGKRVEWEAGDYALEQAEVTIEAGLQSINIGGHSKLGTQFLQAGGGIKIIVNGANRSLRDAGTSVQISNLSFITTQTGLANALWIDWGPWDTTTITSGVPSAMGRGFLHRISDVGFGATSTSRTYLNPLRLSCVSDMLIDNVHGQQQGQVGSGILFDHPGGEDRMNGVNTMIRRCTIMGYDKAVENLAPSEGLMFDHPSFTDNNYGIYANWATEATETTQPELDVVGGHFNNYVAQVYTVNWRDVSVQGTLMYVNDTAKGIYLSCPGATNKIICPSIIGNRINRTGSTHTGVTAIELADNMGLGVIANNQLTRFGTNSIVLGASTSGNHGVNYGYSCAAVSDSGTNNSVTLTTQTLS